MEQAPRNVGGIVEGDGGIDEATAGASVVDAVVDIEVDVVEDEVDDGDDPQALTTSATSSTRTTKKARTPPSVWRVRIT